ncbi:MAG TPA: glycosyltransferase [Acetivibrio sp.]|uniref:glycosyltransferase n=1 Tax=Acetivibrio sp. TaxID=1872092 RepID=UPI002B6137AC|nr:glycosyltransferase [Acetivibrio sp.]HOM03836.1 glycosyltransferase [Acetivibrio sp.]
MKIMVFCVPATTGGSLTILEEYYKKAVKSADVNVQWIFVVSTPEFNETENIRVLNYPWVKKSWFHRVVFDCLVAPQIVRKQNPDEILSLQNVTIPFARKFKQVLYVQQSLPFVDYKFCFKENRLYWTYQNIIGRLIIRSIRKANEIIVQTNWMKEACSQKAKVNPSKIRVDPPELNIEVRKYFSGEATNLRTFFYPASPNSYKNHKIILQACKKLKEVGIDDYRVVLTINGHENKYALELYEAARQNGLPIEFIGSLKREEVYEWYSKSVLIFPSYIETFGLPLLEAKLHKTPIIASDTPFSHEILDDYENVWFFEPFDADELCKIMLSVMNLEQLPRVAQR